MNSTDKFITSLIEFENHAFEENVKNQARLCLLDYIGCTCIGNGILKEQQLNLLNINAHDFGAASIIGSNCKTSLQNAALINGIYAHVAELDDGHRYAMMHPGATVFSALIPIAETVAINFNDFLRGIIVGYEASVRISAAIQPSHKLKGFHASGTCGTIGAAMGIASMLKLTAVQRKAILSAAATDASALLECMDDSSKLKPYNIGSAASAAINACISGIAGFAGPNDILGGERGFFVTHTDQVNEEYLFNGINHVPAILQIYRKPYAACRHCHAPIDAVLNIKNTENIEINNIKKIIIETYSHAIKGHAHKNVANISSAKMSIPFSVALALIKGSAGYKDYDDPSLQNEQIKLLISKIDIIENEEMSVLVPRVRAASARIIKQTGKELFCRVDYPKGEPENPMSVEEIKLKASELMTFSGISAPSTEKIFDLILNKNCKLSELLSVL